MIVLKIIMFINIFKKPYFFTYNGGCLIPYTKINITDQKANIEDIFYQRHP